VPELPDLLYIRDHLREAVVNRQVRSVTIKEPLIVRNALDRPATDLLVGAEFLDVEVHGPFLRLPTSGTAEVVINLMLAGRLQLQQPGERPVPYLAASFELSDERRFNLGDEEKMAKLYLVPRNELRAVPGYLTQGLDILGPAFTLDAFRALARRHSRKQVRSFINDHQALSAIGNAYADEILFEARLHPKTLVARLSAEEVLLLYEAVRSVMDWGIRAVRDAGEPIHVKVRGHLKVRNRRGEPCPRCGTTIRREGVRGHDVFFCPACQQTTRKVFVDWRRIPGTGPVPPGSA
jgi:formamidopyrimidine-DNA glycosylase